MKKKREVVKKTKQTNVLSNDSLDIFVADERRYQKDNRVYFIIKSQDSVIIW